MTSPPILIDSVVRQPGRRIWGLDVRAEMTLIFGRMLRTNSLIGSRLRTLLLPQCFLNSGRDLSRKNSDAAKLLT